MAAENTHDVLLNHNRDSHVASLVLNRPQSLNAINISMLNAIITALKEVQALEAKVCIISGAGSSFCSGEDLKQTLAPKSNGKDADELRDAFQKLQEITRLMTMAGTVFIASIQGWAVGGGAEIALAADFVIAGPQAKFSFPEVLHGHAPTGGITARLPQIIGLQRAKKALLLGEPISAVNALAMNLITELVDDPLAYSEQLAGRLACLSARSLAVVKKNLELATFPHQEEALLAEVAAASWCFADPLASIVFEEFKARKRHLATSELRIFNGEELADWPYSSKVAPLLAEKTPITFLLDAAKSHGSHPFLRFGRTDICYRQFKEDVARLGGGLTSLGISEGNIVGGMMLNSYEMTCVWFATNWIGAIWAPLNTDFRGKVLERSLCLVAPKLFIVDHALLATLPKEHNLKLIINTANSPEDVADVSSTLKYLMSFGPVQPTFTSATSTACLLFTSGTTGPSKACELPHTYFLAAGNALISSLQLKDTDVLYCPFPLYHADATSFTIIPALMLRTTAAISLRFSASRWWDDIRHTRATVADFMGATMSILFKSAPHPSDKDHSLRIMWGVPVPIWADKFEERFGVRIVEVYGQTEMGLPVVQNLDKPRVIGSCGVALPGIQLRVVNEHGVDVTAGCLGEILVFEDTLTRFKGYYQDLEATNKSIRNGWFYTGDLGRLDAEGNLYFGGRKKQAIRRRGENISAFEVQEAIMLHPDIMECAAFGVPSDLTEEDLAIAVVKCEGSQLTAENLHKFSVQTMTKFHIPRFVHFTNVLPKTATGKLQSFMLWEYWKKLDRSQIWDSTSAPSS